MLLRLVRPGTRREALSLDSWDRANDEVRMRRFRRVWASRRVFSRVIRQGFDVSTQTTNRKQVLTEVAPDGLERRKMNLAFK